MLPLMVNGGLIFNTGGEAYLWETQKQPAEAALLSVDIAFHSFLTHLLNENVYTCSGKWVGKAEEVGFCFMLFYTVHYAVLGETDGK